MKTKLKKPFTCHTSLIALCLLLSACCLLPFGTAFAQTDEQLLGTWNLERVEIGINHTNTDFISTMENIKCSFTAVNGQLTLALPEKEPRTFAYTLDGNLLKISFTRAGEQYSLTYKK
ncbi:MAG: hypothetical protein LBH91_06865 [Prevotellaceae bacterium]|nr:hypothetical protein [Prevotellaceae bacterium]